MPSALEQTCLTCRVRKIACAAPQFVTAIGDFAHAAGLSTRSDTDIEDAMFLVTRWLYHTGPRSCAAADGVHKIALTP